MSSRDISIANSDVQSVESEAESESDSETKSTGSFQTSHLDDSNLERSDNHEENALTSTKSSIANSEHSSISVSSHNSDDSNKNLEIPETDSEEDEKPALKPKFKRIMYNDSSSDEEEKVRKSLYQAETDDEDHQPPIEERAFSKATRRSIEGFPSPKRVIPKFDDTSDEDDSGSIIVEESEDDEEEKQSVPSTELPTLSIDEKESNSDFVRQSLSSTMRSPLQEVSQNKISLSHDSFNSSISTKMSSTVSIKEDSSLLDEAIGGLSIEKVKVSTSEYEAEVAALESYQKQLKSLKKGLELASKLPDRGEKLQRHMNVLLETIDKKKQFLSTLEIDENRSIKKEIARSFQSDHENISAISVEENVIVYNKVDDVKPVFTGKVGMKNFNTQKALTVEKLEDIQQSIEARPAETVLGTPPKHLKLTLMNHQLHAIAFMMWREKQNPRGGILADDMGLGKTMTTISLILKGIQANEENDGESSSDEDESEDDDWKARGRKDMRDGGTLIICPASLLKQWEAEIQTKVKRGAIEHYVFHGANREYKARTLAKHDVVLTTYQLVVTEEKNNGCLFQVKWKRIVLDEGHVIRNHKSKQSEAICKLQGKYRWVLTGTPIHNKEFDLYAAIKFLRCRPFDDLQYWKHWIEIKGRDSSPRVQALLKAIMLRRTKQGLIETGEIQSLPEKIYKEFHVKLNTEERLVYNRFMAFSKNIFAAFLEQQQAKNSNFTYDKNHLGRLYEKFSNRFTSNQPVKAHEILTLLLRMRQICCHPGLAKSNLECLEADGEINGMEVGKFDDSDSGLLKQLESLNLHGADEHGRESMQVIDVNNEVFNMDIPSSKIVHMMDVLREHVMGSDDKAIIVSQWTSYLSIIRGMLEVEGVSYCELNGTIPVKDRNDIVVKFNKHNSGVKVMLLSLTAGGVGLNLVGANYLFLMDLHWNPQLEQQAQDRIYRFGQQKKVNIFKFVCLDTIEERILKIQQGKLDTATASLTGAKKAAGSKLTIDELKILFGMV